ncbi:hypothetical protein HDV00_004296 [Rhizophlyctis rosea]|nr:hypothetical protein HDV00_004296 [Rhizophlyctis rosea]
MDNETQATVPALPVLTDIFLPLELFRMAARTHPDAATKLRQSHRTFSRLITYKDLVWAVAAWKLRKSTFDNRRACWSWAVSNHHIEVLRSMAPWASTLPDESYYQPSECPVHALVHAGAWTGDVALFTLAREIKPKVQICDSAMVVVVEQGHADMLKMFLASGRSASGTYQWEDEGDPEDREDENYYAFLEIAAIKGHLEVGQILLSEGTGLNRENEYALVWASSEGNLEMVETLVAAMRDGVHGDSDILHTALGAPCEGSSVSALPVVQFLLKKGADIHSAWSTCLLGAAENGHTEIMAMLLEIVRALLTHGADVADRNSLALQGAAQGGQLEMMQILVGAGARFVDFPKHAGLHIGHTAATEGQWEAIKFMLVNGAPIGAGLCYALHEAIRDGQEVVSESLIETVRAVRSDGYLCENVQPWSTRTV